MPSRFFKNFFQSPDKTFWFFSVIAIAIILLSANIPFFWDNIALSENACFYYDNSFSRIIPPLKSDFGTLTLYSYYLPFFWTLFGKSLWVSHLAMIPIVVGIFWEIKKISLRFIRPEYLAWVYLLILFDPALSTQIILIGYDIFLLYFVLLAIRTLLEKKFLYYAVSLLLLSAISTRGIIFVFCLLLIHGLILLFIDKDNPQKRDLMVYLPAMIFLCIWLVYHFLRTGWILSNPLLINHRNINDPAMVFRQLGFIIWKIADSGRMALWAFCIISVFVIFKKTQWSEPLKKLVLVLILPLVVNVFIMIFISNPIGHKYFLPTFVFLSILVVYFVQQLPSPKKRIIISLSLLLFLFGGNFIMYPQKYGNAWDTSLKVLPFFKAERQMKTFIEQKNINPSEVYTEFPLNANNRYSYLEEDFSYSELKASEISNYPYVLFSNIVNAADMSPYAVVRDHWTKVFEISAAQVYLVLYKNPAHLEKH